MPAWILRLGEYDERLLHAVVTRRLGWLDTVVRFLTRLGDPPVAIALAGGVALGMAGDLGGAQYVPAFSLAFSFLISQVLKRFFSRTRPDLPVGITSLIQAPDRFSFPSGHATAALSIALPLAMALPLLLGLAVLVVGMAVGLTRCYLGVHYPGDVMAGWSLAAISVLLAPSLLTLFG
ncbi:MAG: phosphatase PAP2 family protein [Gemmatimonadota bacterium]|jgi:undecaprenyl-diphosphatase